MSKSAVSVALTAELLQKCKVDMNKHRCGWHVRGVMQVAQVALVQMSSFISAQCFGTPNGNMELHITVMQLFNVSLLVVALQ